MAEEVKVIVRLVDRVKTQMGGLRASLRSIAGSIKAFGLGGAAAVGTLIASLVNLGRVSGRQVDAERQLAAALGRTQGNISKNIAQYKQLASAIQKTTTFGDEEILSQIAYAKNLGVTEQNLEQVTIAAIGLSKRMRVDLRTAIMLVARAQGGNTELFTRYGIQLDKTASAQQKFTTVLNMGMRAFRLAQEEVETTSGALKQLSNAWGDLQEGLGGFTQSSGMINVIRNITAGINTLNMALANLTGSAGWKAFKKFGEFATPQMNFVRRLHESITKARQVGGRVNEISRVTGVEAAINGGADATVTGLKGVSGSAGGRSVSLREVFDRGRGQAGGSRVLGVLEAIRTANEQQASTLKNIADNGVL